MSTTPTNKSEATLSAKTPGWTAGLFGIFSTAKKSRPVGNGTDSTKPSPSPQRRAVVDIALPSESNIINSPTRVETAAAIVGASKNNDPDGFFSPQAAAHGNSAHSFTTTTMRPTVATMPAKSPWKNHSFHGGVSFSTGTLKPSTNGEIINGRGTSLTAANGTRRKKRYRASLFLTKSRNRAVNLKTSLMVLRQSESLFQPTKTQQSRLQNYDRVLKPGKRMLGETQRASRLPPFTSADTEAIVSTEEPQAKRQKKVEFESMETEPSKPAATSTALSFGTPVPKKKLPVKSTPFKIVETPTTALKSPSASASTPKSTPTRAKSPYIATPESSRKKFEPLPDIKRLVDPPYTNWGTPEDFPSLGSPVTGSGTKFDIELAFRTKDPGNSVSQLPEPLYYEPKAKKKKEKKTEAATQVSSAPSLVEDTNAHPTKRSKTIHEPTGWGNIFVNNAKDKWKCDDCYVMNSNDLNKCASCGSFRPGFEANGSTSSKDAIASASSGSIDSGGFSFGGASKPDSSAKLPSISSSGFTFGSSAASVAPAPSTRGFAFGAASSSSPKTGGFSFGATAAAAKNNDDSKTNTSGFTFGGNSGATKTDSVSKPASAPAFTFGATSKPADEKDDKKDTPVTSGFNFGAPVPAGDSAKPPDEKKTTFTFGSTASSSPAPAKTATAKATFSFGSTPPAKPEDGEVTESKPKRSRDHSGDSSSDEAATSKASISFGGSSTSGESSSKKPAFSFGGSSSSTTPAATTPAGSSSSTFKFGNAPAPAAPAQSGAPATPAFSFGGASSVPTPAKPNDAKKESAPSFAFGSVKSKRGRDEDNEEPKPKISFGSTTPKEAPTPAFGGFGATLTTPATFGSTPAPAQEAANSDSAAKFSFGSTVPAAGATPVPSTTPFKFGTVSSSDKSSSAVNGGLSGDSSSSSNPKPTFGAPAPGNLAAPMFGRTPVGEAPAPTPAFGSTPAGGASAATPSFGSTPAAPAFGSTTPAAPAPSGPFGGGAPATTPATPSGSFTFGAAPVTTPAAQTFGSTTPAAPSTGGFGMTPAPAAPFGSTAAAPAPFGNPTTPAAGGFGAPASAPFGPGATPASFGASAPGGFGPTPAPAPFGAPAGGGFGSSSASAPFGSQAAPTSFGAPSSFGGAAPQTFGAAAPAPFGNPTPAAGGFGAPAATQPFGGGSGGFGTPAVPPMGMNPGGGGGVGFSIGTGGKSNSRTPGTRRRIRAKRPGRA